jgi:phosphohistidine swiveling domain-containing protein
MLQSFDVARAAARRIGDDLAAAHRLDDPDDVFFLTVAEAIDPAMSGHLEVVAQRRATHAAYRRLAIPGSWSATPAPVPIEIADTGGLPDADTVAGVGVSSGVVTGTARVLMTPDFAAVEPGEILVAPHTDPSWSSVMFLSAGLVVDIGGALSHTALVARELGLPCVVNTGDGTRRIRTGDRIRVDGGSGAVEVLARSDIASKEQSAP